MTAVGKILVFFNLLLSVVTAALIVLVFVTRTNWKTAYEQLDKKYTVEAAAHQAEQSQHQQALQAQENSNQNLQREITTLAQRLNELEASNETLMAENERLSSAQDDESTNNSLAAAELKRVQQERDGLKTKAQTYQDKINELTQQNNNERNKAVQAQIAKEAAQQRNERLLERVETLVKENRTLQYQVNALKNGEPTTSSSVLTSLPPQVPQNVSAKVTAVRGNLVQIAGGTDQGIRVGAVLDLYRLVPENPEASKYLGKLRIRQAEPKRAVGQYTAEVDEPVRVGDQAGTILAGTATQGQ